MVEGKIDVLLPTAGQRMNGYLFQVQAILNNSYKNIRLWSLIDHDDPKVVRNKVHEELKFDNRHTLVEVPTEWRGKHGHRPIKYVIENLPLDGEWIITSGDDDVIMEWALEKLIDNGNEVDMVIGMCDPVKRNHDYVDTVLGEKLECGRITGSCCLYKRERVQEVGYDDSLYEADWVLIEKMLNYPHRQINTVLFAMPQDYR